MGERECDALLRAHSVRVLHGSRRYAYSHPMTNTYRTAEAAKMLGVHPSTLRRWDEKGILRPSIRTPTGERRYTDADLLNAQEKEEIGRAHV